jgi:ectoine hydroxylase-related dioxygenase (phytanoyl-CoA dioxygenase family)
VDSRQIICELPTGGATIHDGRTIHYAGPNLSDRPRRALVFGFGLPSVLLDNPNHYPWQRPEWSQPPQQGH